MKRDDMLLMGLCLVSLLFLSSCTLISKAQMSSADLRLASLRIPDVVKEDLPYDVVVTFNADEPVTIKRACFRWIAEKSSVVSPSLYCYASEVQSNDPIGSVCSRWLAEGPFSQASPEFCVDVERVKTDDVPPWFVVKIKSENVKLFYNKVECYVQYLQDGVTKTSNRVAAPILVEK